jgi:hypothetical protein
MRTASSKARRHDEAKRPAVLIEINRAKFAGEADDEKTYAAPSPADSGM